MPQKIRVEENKKYGVFFRVNRVMKKSRIKVVSDGNVLASFSREHMAPGEMERIDIPAILLNKAGNTVTVETEAEE